MINPIRKGLILFVLSFTFFSCSEEPVYETTELIVPIDTVASISKSFYGLDSSSFHVKRGRFGRNEFIATVLLENQLSYPEIQKLEEKARDVYPVNKIQANQQYTILCNKDSLQKAAYFIFETDPANYIVYDFTDSIAVYKGEKETEIRIRESAGIINSSLYQTIAENDMDILLAIELGDLYAWTVDFYRIQKGDYFKVIYEEKYVEGVRFGTGKIHAALFGHRGENFYAFRFKQDSIFDYYDENGNSLRKAFLKAPLKFSRISSRYTKKRFHPVQKRWKAHLGTDYAAPSGTPILSTGNGEVIASQYSQYNGNYVKIKHNSVYTTQYLHMSKRAVNKGQRVKQGDVIGYVGSTGLATGPHVCYRFWKNGSQVDPYKQKLPASTPIHEDYRNQFFIKKDSLFDILDKIELDLNTVETQTAGIGL